MQIELNMLLFDSLICKMQFDLIPVKELSLSCIQFLHNKLQNLFFFHVCIFEVICKALFSIISFFSLGSKWLIMKAYVYYQPCPASFVPPTLLHQCSTPLSTFSFSHYTFLSNSLCATPIILPPYSIQVETWWFMDWSVVKDGKKVMGVHGWELQLKCSSCYRNWLACICYLAAWMALKFVRYVAKLKVTVHLCRK